MANGGFYGTSPTHVIDIEKFYNGEYWSNRYLCNVADMDAAEALGRDVLARERASHFGFVNFTKVSLRTWAPNDDDYRTLTINQAGTKGNNTSAMPLFVVMRVDFTVTKGRPSRKYLRACLDESEVDTFTINGASLALMNQIYATPVSQLLGLCDPQGAQFRSGAVSPNIAMRQLRRGSKKKNTQSSTGTPPTTS